MKWFFSGCLLLLMFILLVGCQHQQREGLSYSGELETTKVRLSSQVSATIKEVFKAEGEHVQTGDVLVLLDTENIQVQKAQQLEKINELTLTMAAVRTQMQQLQSQISFNRDLLLKTEALVSAGALMAQKQSELTTLIDVLNAQMEGLKVNNKMTASRVVQLHAAVQLLDIQLNNSIIKSPLSGILINKFHSQGEWVNPATPIVEVADLSVLEARVYVPLNELPNLAIGQSVQVMVDGIRNPISGKISWISEESEFTPKTILTRETRTTLVYAVKIAVPNAQGALKMGMPVDVDIPR